MKSNKILKIQEDNKKNIQNDKSPIKKSSFNSNLIDKIKKLNKQIADKNIPFDFIKLDKKITSFSHKNSKKFEESKINDISKSNIFYQYNFSNINNIRRIYLKNNNYFATEIDHKYFNKSHNNYFIKQKEDNNFNNYKLKKDLEPIYEIYNPFTKENFRKLFDRIYNNKDIKQNSFQNRHISPKQVRRIKNEEQENFNIQKFRNYYPYVENIKKMRLSNSNDNILLNNRIYNSSHNKNNLQENYNNNIYQDDVSSINLTDRTQTSKDYFLTKEDIIIPIKKYSVYDNIKERQNITTHNRPNKFIKKFEIKNNYINNMGFKQLSFRKYFGDNYKYFERNLSPLKENNTFHNRRSPAHVFGYENYLILEDAKNRLLVSPFPIKRKKKRKNSETNISKFYTNKKESIYS